LLEPFALGKLNLVKPTFMYFWGAMDFNFKRRSILNGGDMILRLLP
jgi:hypothetical protein